MKEKKQFFIPRNYDKKFEWIPGISGWQHLAFVPVIIADYYFIKYTSFQISNKITFVVASLGLPWILMGTKPIKERENVSLYQFMVWRIKFLKRQRVFNYKKERYTHDVESKNENVKKRIIKRKENRKTKEVNSGSNTNQRHSEWNSNNARQSDDTVSKGISHKHGVSK